MEEEGKVEEEINGTATKVPDFKKPLEKMTAPELKEVAKEIPGLTGVHAMKKVDLVDLIREYYGIEEKGPAREKRKKADKQKVSVKELKAKIIQLRDKKEEARANKDRKNVEILRRRINRLKKKTRKVAQG